MTKTLLTLTLATSPIAPNLKPTPLAGLTNVGAELATLPPEAPAFAAALNRAFSGEIRFAPSDVGVVAVGEISAPELHSQVNRLMDFVAGQPRFFRTPGQIARGMRDRARRVIAVGGIPKDVPAGFLQTRTIFEPIVPEVLDELPKLADTIMRISEGGGRSFEIEIGELFYYIRTLASRTSSRRKLQDDLRWLWGTYRLGQ